jgi:hypothetical protein
MAVRMNLGPWFGEQGRWNSRLMRGQAMATGRDDLEVMVSELKLGLMVFE